MRSFQPLLILEQKRRVVIVDIYTFLSNKLTHKNRCARTTRNYIASTNSHSITNNVNTTNTANTVRFIANCNTTSAGSIGTTPYPYSIKEA